MTDSPLSSSLFGSSVEGDEDAGTGASTIQTGKSHPKFTGGPAFASQGRGNFTSAGKALSLRSDMMTSGSKFGGLLFEGTDPDNPWGNA